MIFVSQSRSQDQARISELVTGHVVTFRGDQRHGDHNPGKVTAVAYSVIAFAPMST